MILVVFLLSVGITLMGTTILASICLTLIAGLRLFMPGDLAAILSIPVWAAALAKALAATVVSWRLSMRLVGRRPLPANRRDLAGWLELRREDDVRIDGDASKDDRHADIADAAGR